MRIKNPENWFIILGVSLFVVGLIFQGILIHDCGWTNAFLYGPRLIWFWLGNYCIAV